MVGTADFLKRLDFMALTGPKIYSKEEEITKLEGEIAELWLQGDTENSKIIEEKKIELTNLMQENSNEATLLTRRTR